jgi:hypothetical protein
MKKAYIYEPLQPFADQLIATVYQHPERFDE